MRPASRIGFTVLLLGLLSGGECRFEFHSDPDGERDPPPEPKPLTLPPGAPACPSADGARLAWADPLEGEVRLLDLRTGASWTIATGLREPVSIATLPLGAYAVGGAAGAWRVGEGVGRGGAARVRSGPVRSLASSAGLVAMLDDRGGLLLGAWDRPSERVRVLLPALRSVHPGSGGTWLALLEGGAVFRVFADGSVLLVAGVRAGTKAILERDGLLLAATPEGTLERLDLVSGRRDEVAIAVPLVGLVDHPTWRGLVGWDGAGRLWSVDPVSGATTRLSSGA